MKLIAIVCGVLLCVCLLPISIEHINEMDKENMTVMVLMGQSNSAYNYSYGGNLADVRADVPCIPEGVAYFYGISSPVNRESTYGDATLSHISEFGLHDMVVDSQWSIYSLEPSIAHAFYDATGEKCLIINVGIGGISVSSLTPSGANYSYAHTIIEDAINKIPSEYNVIMGPIFWLQGERDKNMAVDTYKETFTTVWDNFRDEFGFNSILISQTREANGLNATTAQAELAGSNEVYLATTLSQTFTLDNGLMYSDDVHYSQKGKDLIGNALGEYYADNLYTVEKVHNQYFSLMSIIPILIIIGLIAALSGIILLRRND